MSAEFEFFWTPCRPILSKVRVVQDFQTIVYRKLNRQPEKLAHRTMISAIVHFESMPSYLCNPPLELGNQGGRRHSPTSTSSALSFYVHCSSSDCTPSPLSAHSALSIIRLYSLTSVGLRALFFIGLHPFDLCRSTCIVYYQTALLDLRRSTCAVLHRTALL